MSKWIDDSQLETLMTRDAAFLAYYMIHKGESEKIIPFLTEQQKIFSTGQQSILDTSYWLWVLGEYLQETKDLQLLEPICNEVNKAIQKVLQQWTKPDKHWLGEWEPAIYLSNLAIHYGALLSIQPFVLNEQIQRGLKAIRECLFAKFIKNGRVVSKLGSNEIYGDIVMTAVPFGLLGIEDRILIEALMVAENELINKGVRLSLSDTYFGGCEHTSLSGLLAWYYLEKGDIGKAKRLISHLEQLADANERMLDIDPSTSSETLYYDAWMERFGGQFKEGYLAEILHAIALQVLETRANQQSTSVQSGVKIIHEPTGKDDPYVFFRYERHPRHPMELDLVRIRVQSEPISVNQQVNIEYSTNGIPNESVSMTLETVQDGEKFWEADIGRFRWGDTVEYQIVVQDGEQITRSDVYRFGVSKWIPLHEVHSITQEVSSTVIQFAPITSKKLTPTLTLHRGDDQSLRFVFDIRADLADQEKSPKLVEWPIGDYMIRFEQDCDTGKYGVYHKQESILQSYEHHGKPFIEILTDGNGVVNKLRIRFEIKQDEHFFGMGERFYRIEYRGLEIDNYVYNEYRNQQLKTYIPIPFFISSAGYGMYLNSDLYSKFRFGSQLADLLEIEADLKQWIKPTEFVIFLGKPLEIIKQFTNVSGKPVLPPKWSFGPWMSSNNWDSQYEVEKQVALTNKYQIPSTVIVLEQWSDEATFYIFNDAQYNVKDGNDSLSYDDFTFPQWGRWPNPKQMVEDLHANGLKVLLWQIPIQKYMYGIPHGQRDADELALLENGYYVKQANEEPYRIPYNWFKDSLVIDFSNPLAKQWWFNKRLYLLQELGVDGFKTDGGECIFGNDVVFYDGSTGAEMRNRYPLDYVGSYYHFVQEHTGGDGVTFSRAGYSGAQSFPLHWAGDERSTYSAFRASIRAGLSCSMSGIPFWGWDLGGFHGDIPTAELFVRSSQMAAFCPVMQYHAETKGEFNQDRTPWNIAERTGKSEVIGLYKKYADLRMNLLPYIYDQAVKCSRHGIPMMRAMFVDFPEDRSCIQLDDQYMFGESLLVAPISEEGQYVKQVYFPKGQWISLFNNESVQGSIWHSVKADLDEIPVYLKENCAVSLNLDASLQLASYVGNRVDQYDHLSFIIYMIDRLNVQFEDDLGNRIDLVGTGDESELVLQCSIQANVPVSLIFKGIEKIIKIEVNDQLLRLVPSVDQMEVGCYCSQELNWVVRLDQTATTLRIVLKS